MNTKFLSSLILGAFLLTTPVCAVTVEESSSPEYLRNRGYSNSMIDMTEYSKASANGEKYISQQDVEHYYDSKLTKFIKRFFNYIDPAVDDGKFMNHDIKLSPSVNDL